MGLPQLPPPSLVRHDHSAGSLVRPATGSSLGEGDGWRTPKPWDNRPRHPAGPSVTPSWSLDSMAGSARSGSARRRMKARGDKSEWSSDSASEVESEEAVLSIRRKPRPRPPPRLDNTASREEERHQISETETETLSRTVTTSRGSHGPETIPTDRSEELLIPSPDPPPTSSPSTPSSKAIKSLEAVKKRLSGGNASSTTRTEDSTPRASRHLIPPSPNHSLHPPQPSLLHAKAPPPIRVVSSNRRGSRSSATPALFASVAATSPLPPPLPKPPGKRFIQHEGNNRFLCGGRLVTSADSPVPLIFSTAVVVAMVGAFGAVEGPWIVRNGGGWGPIAAFIYSCLVMISSMLATAFRDPGIVPRGLDPSPETEWLAQDPKNLTGPGRDVPKRRWVQARHGHSIPTSWCETCETYRPPRSSHCRICDNCVVDIDHHCTFLNTCIGRRNYTPFFAFLLSSTLNLLFVIGYSVALLILLHRASPSMGGGVGEFLLHPARLGVGSLVVGGAATVLVLPVGGLFLFHAVLVARNCTTIERLRPKTTRQEFKALHSLDSVPGNCLAVLCRPIGVSSTPAAFWKVTDGSHRPPPPPTCDRHLKGEPKVYSSPD